ncbi:4495_t:CDS:1, partial [Dentiscutata heterogama]
QLYHSLSLNAGEMTAVKWVNPNRYKQNKCRSAEKKKVIYYLLGLSPIEI